jgi:hypothetical protein
VVSNATGRIKIKQHFLYNKNNSINIMPAPVPPKGKPVAGKAVPPKGKPVPAGKAPVGKAPAGKAVPPKESPKDKMARLREMQNKKKK